MSRPWAIQAVFHEANVFISMCCPKSQKCLKLFQCKIHLCESYPNSNQSTAGLFSHNYVKIKTWNNVVLTKNVFFYASVYWQKNVLFYTSREAFLSASSSWQESLYRHARKALLAQQKDRIAFHEPLFSPPLPLAPFLCFTFCKVVFYRFLVIIVWRCYRQNLR